MVAIAEESGYAPQYLEVVMPFCGKEAKGLGYKGLYLVVKFGSSRFLVLSTHNTAP